MTVAYFKCSLCFCMDFYLDKLQAINLYQKKSQSSLDVSDSSHVPMDLVITMKTKDKSKQGPE